MVLSHCSVNQRRTPGAPRNKPPPSGLPDSIDRWHGDRAATQWYRSIDRAGGFHGGIHATELAFACAQSVDGTCRTRPRQLSHRGRARTTPLRLRRTGRQYCCPEQSAARRGGQRPQGSPGTGVALAVDRDCRGFRSRRGRPGLLHPGDRAGVRRVEAVGRGARPGRRDRPDGRDLQPVGRHGVGLRGPGQHQRAVPGGLPNRTSTVRKAGALQEHALPAPPK